MLAAIGLAFRGFLLGVRRAVDPDHGVAFTAITVELTGIGMFSTSPVWTPR